MDDDDHHQEFAYIAACIIKTIVTYRQHPRFTAMWRSACDDDGGGGQKLRETACDFLFIPAWNVDQTPLANEQRWEMATSIMEAVDQYDDDMALIPKVTQIVCNHVGH